MKNLKRILGFVFPRYWEKALLNFIFVLLSVIFGLFSFTLVIPFLNVLFENTEPVSSLLPFKLNMEVLQNNFNYYLNQIVAEYGKPSALLYLSVFVVVAVFFKTTFLYLSKYVMASLRSRIVCDIRDELYQKIVKLPMGYFSNERKGDVMSRMTNDVGEIEFSILRSIDVVFKDPVSIIGSLVILLYLSPRLTIFVFLLLPIAGFLIGKIGSSLRRKSVKAQSKLGDIITIIEETLSGLRIIKAFNAQRKVNDRFAHENKSYSNLYKKMYRRRDMAGPISELLSTIILVMVLWYGGQIVLKGGTSLTGASLLGYLVVFSQIIPSAKSFTDAYYNMQKGLASIERIDVILNAPITIQDKNDPISVDGFNHCVEYQDVFFKYRDEMVLKGINLKVEKGKTIALVGQSGSGKSTMVDLLPRFYDVFNGSIKVDGNDIRDIKIYDLRKLMGIVSQESILFNDSIFNNIAFGVDQVTKEEVIAAAKIANAHDFIMETPEGYETNIGDRGGKLSGGQRQRLSIARAILANPPIMILDEATSALDTESEKLVQESLERLMQNRTSIVIAHRLSTVIHADLICVLHEGQIIEQGTHEELLTLNGQYKKLHDIQMFA